MRTKFKNVANLLFIVLFASCSREGIVENGETDNGKIAVATEVSVDGVELTTRAASEAGYTTGDGLYDKEDKVTVAAFANDGYELAAFYDKRYPSINLGASHNLTVAIPQIFKAEFRKKGFTIIVNASPTNGGTVTGGGSYSKGSSCTLTATPNNDYTFDGWYEGSTKVSTRISYNFTVSSNRTITARFIEKIKTYTVTIKIAEWLRNSWFVGTPAPGDVRWFPYTDSDEWNTIITKSFKKGEICRFKCSFGGDSGGSYTYNGVFDINHTSVTGYSSEVNDKDRPNGIYFTVTKDVTYYVEAMYMRN